MDALSCPKCDRVAFPQFVMANSGKLVARCSNPDCVYEDHSLGPSNFNRGVAVVADGNGVRQVIPVTTSAPPEPPRQMSLQPMPQLAQPAPAAAPVIEAPPPMRASAAPGDVIGWIEDRAAWLAAEEARLEGEIATTRAKLAGLRVERRRLDKMLRAGRREFDVRPLAKTAPTVDRIN